MVGTGRFELPNALVLANERPLANVLVRAFASRPRGTLGCSRSALKLTLGAEICAREKMVGTGRFELPTPRTPSECATRLRHVPTEELVPSTEYQVLSGVALF
jgi:hypothetical protein